MDQIAVEAMDLAAAPVSVKTADRQGNHVLAVSARMNIQDLALNARKPDAGDARGHAGEELGDQ